MKNPEFFYCYSKKLFHFLKDRGFQYICTGLNENTYKKFWQFRSSPELNQALSEYKNKKNSA